MKNSEHHKFERLTFSLLSMQLMHSFYCAFSWIQLRTELNP